MIKAIIFDIGGVYFQGSFRIFLNDAYKYLGIDKHLDSLEEIMIDEDFNRGKIDVRECFERVFETKLSGEQLDHLVDMWTGTWNPNPEMVELCKKLKKEYTLAVLSNSDEENSMRFHANGWYDIFDVLVLSHVEGEIKPEQKIYEITLKRLNLKPDECLFIDDQIKNIDAAKKLGIKSILFKSVEQLKDDLKKFGVTF